MKVIAKLVKIIKKELNKKISISSKEKLKLKLAEAGFPKLITEQKMLKMLQKGASMSRFGDGEFEALLMSNPNNRYQKPSEALSEKLIEILKNKSNEEFIVAIPPFNPKYNNTQRYYKQISFFETFWMKNWDRLNSYLTQKIYGNSFISRDSAFYSVDVSEYRKIWEGKKVVFIVSREGRFEMDDRLFGNMLEKSYIYVSPSHAFSDLEFVLKEVSKYSKDHIFFISAGVAATVFAYEIYKMGYQALDFGHLPNCYRQYLGETAAPERLPIVNKEKSFN